MNNMIPKIIFQTYEGKYENLPEHYKQTSLSWQRLNPGWAYVYHDRDQRDEYVKTFSPELYKTYGRVIKPHQADIWRYLILKNEGGVYADMDSFCSTPMDYILDKVPDTVDIVCTKTEDRNHTNNANFAAVKRSVILTQCIEDILVANRKERNSPDQTVIHQCFSDGVLNNPEKVSKTMKAEHGHTYKRKFDQDNMKIDYYGEKISYGDLLTKYNMI